jgi:Protein phosphatase 2C
LINRSEEAIFARVTDFVIFAVSQSMHIYSLLQIGSFHTLHCEDALITTEIGPGRILLAVMDGCTMGDDSHLPSTLTAKLLRKISREIDFEIFRDRRELALGELEHMVLERLFAELRFLKNHIQLEKSELLCTLVMALVDVRTREANVIVVGDGWVDCNGEGTEFEQDNRPDYLGYHLAEDFGEWFGAQTQRLQFTNVHELSIATDGILSFQQAVLGEFEPVSSAEIVDQLLRNRAGRESTTMLQARLKHIAQHHGQGPTDDLAILRVIL